MNLPDHIGSIASLIGSLTVVGGALLWFYNKVIGEPREKRRLSEEAKRQAAMLTVVNNANKPLNNSIKQLTQWLEESKTDRLRLNEMAIENRKRIIDLEDSHELWTDRVIVLETVNKLGKSYSYPGGE